MSDAHEHDHDLLDEYDELELSDLSSELQTLEFDVEDGVCRHHHQPARGPQRAERAGFCTNSVSPLSWRKPTSGCRRSSSPGAGGRLLPGLILPGYKAPQTALAGARAP